MKTIIISCRNFLNIFIFSSALSYGQIPNSSFESWQTLGNCEEPIEWTSTNIFDSTLTYCPVTRSSDHYPLGSGNYSIRLENNTALLPSFSALGTISTTKLDGSDKPLFPIIGHPNSLCGYYKFNSVNGDTMSIGIYLSYNGVELAMGRFMTSNSVSNWTPFNIPISSYVMADSARITIMSANIEGAGVQGNSVLYIDNLSFDTLIVDNLNDPINKDDLKLFPNPCSQILNLKSTRSKMVSLSIYDLSGREIRYVNIPQSEATFTVNVSDLEEGVYVASIRYASDLVVTRKLQVSR